MFSLFPRLPSSDEGLVARVGVINIWTQNDLYHDPCEVIIMSRMGVSEIVNDDYIKTLGSVFFRNKSFK